MLKLNFIDVTLSFCLILYNVLGLAQNTNFVSGSDSVLYTYAIVEVNPEPIGGREKMYTEIAKSLDFSTLNRIDTLDCTRSFSCTVFVKCVISEKGEMTNFEIARGIDGSYDSVAIASLRKSSIRWSPGIKQGKAVKTLITIPIRFAPSTTRDDKKKRRR